MDTSYQIRTFDNLIVNFKLKPEVLKAFISRGSAILSYSDQNGSSSYEVIAHRENGKVVQVDDLFNDTENKLENGPLFRTAQTCDPPDCGNLCDSFSNVEFCFCGDGGICNTGDTCRHEPRENEDYFIAWKHNNPDHCKVELTLQSMYFFSISNSEPFDSPFSILEDPESSSQEVFFPSPFYFNITDMETGTFRFPSNWKIEADWLCGVTYCIPHDPPDCPEIITISSYDTGYFQFDSAFDITNPDFANLYAYGITSLDYDNPVLLTGMELAAYLEDIFSIVPLLDDPNYLSVDIHCSSNTRDQLYGTPDPYPDRWGNFSD